MFLIIKFGYRVPYPIRKLVSEREKSFDYYYEEEVNQIENKKKMKRNK